MADGGACDGVRTRCRAGLICLGGADRCTRACDPAADDCPDDRACLELAGGLGGCSPGMGQLGEPCADRFECASALCALTNGEGV